MKLPHFFNQVSRCTRSEPVRIHFSIGEAIQQAVRIEDIRRRPAEMIAIIMTFQLLDGFFPAEFQFLSQFINIIAHLGQQFLLGDTADAGIRHLHTHILDVVQLAEDAELRELRDACQEHKSEQWLAIFQRTVEIAHRIAQNIEFFLLMRHIEQWCIILIDEHHSLLASLYSDSFYQVEQTNVWVWRITIHSKPILIFLQYK